jgi:hypothetical protein
MATEPRRRRGPTRCLEAAERQARVSMIMISYNVAMLSQEYRMQREVLWEKRLRKRWGAKPINDRKGLD